MFITIVCMTVERIHPKAPVMLIFIAIFTCLPSCINLSNIVCLVQRATHLFYAIYIAVYSIQFASIYVCGEVIFL